MKCYYDTKSDYNDSVPRTLERVKKLFETQPDRTLPLPHSPRRAPCAFPWAGLEGAASGFEHFLLNLSQNAEGKPKYLPLFLLSIP